MRGDVLNQVVRVVVLALLLGYFAYSLVHGLMLDERQKGFGGPVRAGADPGVRVLIEISAPFPDPSIGWDRLELHMLLRVDVITSEAPEAASFQLHLGSGAVLRIQPAANANIGIELSAAEWGKDYIWPVSVIRIQPQQTDPQAPILANGTRAVPGRRDPRGFEAQDHDSVFSFAGCTYRGSLEVRWHSPKEVAAINCLPMEAYVEGVIAVEMSPAFPLQALKAQAVVSRSYAFAKAILSHDGNREYDVLDTSDDQEYHGSGKGNEAVRTATYQTRGVVLTVSHYPFTPLFCASSGGYTESIDNVLPGATTVRGSEPLGTVMVAQPDPYCRLGCEGLGYLGSHWTTTCTITTANLRNELAKLYAPENRSIGWIRSLRAGKRDPRSGRVLSVLIYHTNSNDPIEMSAHYFRMMVGSTLLRSTLWSADSPMRKDVTEGERSRSYEIGCTGFGHGVGLSQVSAWQMANENFSYLEILRRFYMRVDVDTEW